MGGVVERRTHGRCGGGMKQEALSQDVIRVTLDQRSDTRA